MAKKRHIYNDLFLSKKWPGAVYSLVHVQNIREHPLLSISSDSVTSVYLHMCGLGSTSVLLIIYFIQKACIYCTRRAISDPSYGSQIGYVVFLQSHERTTGFVKSHAPAVAPWF